MSDGDITVVKTITGTTTNGEDIKGMSNSKTYSSIADVYERTIIVDTTERTIISISSGEEAGATLSALNYFAVKNLSSTYPVMVGLKSASDTSYIRVDAGESFELSSVSQDTNTSGAAFSAFVSITSITLTAVTTETTVSCGVLAF